ARVSPATAATAEASSAIRVGTRASVRVIAIPPSKLGRGRWPAAAGDRDEQAAARQRVTAHVHDPVVAEVLALERQDERGAEGRKTDRGAGDGAARDRRPVAGVEIIAPEVLEARAELDPAAAPREPAEGLARRPQREL